MTLAQPSLQLVASTSLRAHAEESACGDACEILSWSRGTALAIADGLGHGPRAREAARVFMGSARTHLEAPLDELFAHAHRALLKTRGAVAALARFDAAQGELCLAGLGNISIIVVRARERRSERPVLSPGVLGGTYRPARPQVLAFGEGDMLVMHTDGIRSRFDPGALGNLSVQSAANTVVRIHARSNDDAGCIVARAVIDRTRGGMLTPAPATGTEEHEIPVKLRSDSECAAQQARHVATAFGLPVRAAWEVSIATAELATNIVKFAAAGAIRLRCERAPRAALVVEAIDGGRGIADLDAAFTDGFSEGAPLGPDRPRGEAGGLGVGLGAVRRLMDSVEVHSSTQGTRIVARKFLAP